MPDETKSVSVEIDQAALSRAIAATVTAGIEKGAASWEVRQEIDKAVQEAMLGANIPQLVRTECERVLDGAAEELAREAVQEVAPVLREAMSRSMQAAMVSMVYGAMRGKPSYMNDHDMETWKRAEQALGVADDEVRDAD